MLQKHYLTYIVLSLLFLEINCQMTSKPKQRVSHTTTLIDDKLYILGGLYYNDSSNEPVGKEFFYLDVSSPFNTQKLLWQDLSSTYTVPLHYAATSAKSGTNQLFLYGGTNQTIMELVYVFDPASNSWNTPKIAGDSAIRKDYLTGIVDYSGKMYLWGGRINAIATNIANDMLILNTVNLSWGKGSSVGAPSPRLSYGAALLPDQTIIYIGGFNGVAELTLNEVYIYNTISNNWITRTTSGKIPSNREGFSTIFDGDQRIVIFGGTTTVIKSNLAPGDSLYVLNLTNYVWYVPSISGKIPAPRMFHKADVIEKYMVVSFGQNYDPSIESDILLLDISNNSEYKWTNNFNHPSSTLEPSSVPSTTVKSVKSTTTLLATQASSAQQPDNNKRIIIGATIGGSLFSGALLFGGFFLYKRNKNKQKQKNAMLLSGNENYNNYDQTERDIYYKYGKEIPINKSYKCEQETPIYNKYKYEYEETPIDKSFKYEQETPIHNGYTYGQEIPIDNKQETIIYINYKNDKNDQETPIDPIDDRHETVETSIDNNQETLIDKNDTINHEPIIVPSPVIIRNHNHKQEAIPIAKNESISTIQNEMISEISTVKKNERISIQSILQVLREEID